MEIYGYHNHEDSTIVLNWSGLTADRVTLVERFEDLSSCKHSMIFVSPWDTNTYFDITKKLINQQNYLVFVDLHETKHTAMSQVLQPLFDDLPAAKVFPIIDASVARTPDRIGMESFLFKTYTFDKKNRPYKFLYLNGRHCSHRWTLWNQLEQSALLDQALKSYLGYQIPGMERDCQISPVTLPTQYDSKYQKIDRLSSQWQSNVRNYFAFKANCWQGQWIDGQLDPINRFTDTYFSLITETWVNDDPFLTEKTFKCLLAGHPFIVLGCPGLYKHIQCLGFETYSHVIDEEFDREEVLTKRISMITSEVSRLCKTDLDQFAEQCKEINQHNRNHYTKSIHDHYQRIHRDLSDWLQRTIEQARQYVESNR